MHSVIFSKYFHSIQSMNCIIMYSYQSNSHDLLFIASYHLPAHANSWVSLYMCKHKHPNAFLLVLRQMHHARRCTWIISWRHHQMETFSTLLALFFWGGNPPVTVGFPSLRPVTRSFDIFFICAWTNGWRNTRDTSDLKRHRTHYDVTSMMAYLLLGSNHYK